MLTLQECFEYCELTEEEIHAVAEHEHVTDIVAAELADCLLASEGGVGRIRQYIVEDIDHALRLGQTAKAQRLRTTLDHFDVTHPMA